MQLCCVHIYVLYFISVLELGDPLVVFGVGDAVVAHDVLSSYRTMVCGFPEVSVQV